MKLPSIRLFFFALNGFVSASPLNPFNEPNGNLLVSPSPDGGLLSPTQKPRNPNIHEGKACSVRLWEFSGHLRSRSKCGGLSVAGFFGMYPGFSFDKWQGNEESDPSTVDEVQCCLEISCVLSTGGEGYCTNGDKACPGGTGETHRCPAAGSLCCSRAAPSSPTSSLPTSDNLLASSDLNLVDPNPPLNVGDLEFNPDDVNNLFTIGDGPTVEADLSAFNPDDSSQVSFGLSGSSLLSDEGPTVASLNDGSDQGNLFASAAGDTSSLDIFS